MSEQMIAAFIDLPWSAYEDEDYFRREHGRLFRTRWCFALHAGYLEPGRQTCVRVGGRELILILDDERRVRAFPNRCVHKGERLLEPGEVERSSVLRCSHHGWNYGLDGRLVSGPGFDVSTRAKVPFLPPIEISLLRNLVVAAPETSRTEGDRYAVIEPHPEGRMLEGSSLEAPVNWKLLARVVSERGWVVALPNLAVLRGPGWEVLLRWEPLAPRLTELVLDRSWRADTANVPGAEMLDEIASAAGSLGNEARHTAGGADGALVDEVEAVVNGAVESAQGYLLSDWYP